MVNNFAQKTIDVEGNTLAYLQAGSGAAVVIVHGVGGHKEDWTAVITALSARHSVYAIDMLGFGGSSRDAEHLGMTSQANAIIALMDHEQIQSADLIGNSVGGWVTATCASHNPDRVNKLVLVDPAGFEAMFQGDPPVNLFPNSMEEMEKLLLCVLHSGFAHTREFAEQAYAGFLASGEKSIVPRLGPGLFQSARLETILPSITSPTLVVWGNEDRLFPVALAPYITSLIPGAKSVIIEEASHFPHIDKPDEFIATVQNFL